MAAFDKDVNNITKQLQNVNVTEANTTESSLKTG